MYVIYRQGLSGTSPISFFARKEEGEAALQRFQQYGPHFMSEENEDSDAVATLRDKLREGRI